MISVRNYMDKPEVPWAAKPVWRSIDCGAGWWPLISELDRQIKFVVPDYEVVQVKEKFGTLRYYINGVPKDVRDKVYDLIHMAEAASGRICEWCGLPAKTHGSGWIRTLCDGCEFIYQMRRYGSYSADRIQSWDS